MNAFHVPTILCPMGALQGVLERASTGYGRHLCKIHSCSVWSESFFETFVFISESIACYSTLREHDESDRGMRRVLEETTFNFRDEACLKEICLP